MPDDSTKSALRTPTQFFLRGLAISLPAILTIIIIIWIADGVRRYLIRPTTAGVKLTLAQFIDRSVSVLDEHGRERFVQMRNRPVLDYCGREYLVTSQVEEDYQAWLAQQDSADTGSARQEWVEQRAEVYVPLGSWAVPYRDYVQVAKVTHADEMPTSATGFYMELAAERYFRSAFLLSAFAVMLVIVALYFLGRLVSAKVGGWAVYQIENNLLGRLPVIRNVYGSAKQVTDFLFTESHVEYRRVVAIEYPRRGIWSLGLVTGESMLDITAAVGEPCLSVLIPSSPMPVTGYTMNVPRSQVLDLNITVDQAFQFCISCGVLVPPNQKVTPQLLQERLQQRLAEELSNDGALRRREGVDDLPIPSVGQTEAHEENPQPSDNGPQT